MAVATFTLTPNGYPSGNDNTQRRQILSGLASIIGASPSYVQGGNRINFANLEQIKVGGPYLLPAWLDIESWAGSGYIYKFNPLGAKITNLALTSNVVTITAKNNLAIGDVVQLSGLTTTSALNGIKLTVLSSGLSATQFEANLTHGNISSAAETGFALPVSYASGLPFQGNLQIFQVPDATDLTDAAPLAELATDALPVGVTGDVIAFRSEFIRLP